MDRVKDKVALITGARRGLGAAIGAMLAREGAKVILSDRKADGSEVVLKQIADEGGEAIFIEHDITNEESWDKAIATCVKKCGKLDILVNNAGVGAGKNIEAATLDEWRWVMGINLDGTFLGTQKAIRTMKTTGSSSIVNISSIEAWSATAVWSLMMPARAVSSCSAARLLCTAPKTTTTSASILCIPASSTPR